MYNILKNLTIIIPTLNEENNISLLLDFITDYYPDSRVIVADDCSTDNTVNIINKKQSENQKIKLIERCNAEYNGLTVSILDAINKTDTEYFIVIDGDMQHPPGIILEMISLLNNRDIDVIVGYKESVPTQTYLYRRLITFLGNLCGKIRLHIKGKPCKDILSGFFGGKTPFFKKYLVKNAKKFELEGYKVLFDFLKLFPKSTKLLDIPFIFGARKADSSKLRFKQMKIFFRSLFK